jgi:hypothetical protein
MIRFATNNAMARATTLTGDNNTAYPASNMLIDVKSLVHRTTDGNHGNTITVTWNTPELVGFVGLPFCNLTSSVAGEVKVYSDTAGTTLVYDSGMVQPCPAPSVVLPGFTAQQAASAYAFGGGSFARWWFNPVMCGKLVISLIDVSNPATNLEFSRLFVSNWWAPSYNVDAGAVLTFASNSSQVRSDGGDLLTNVGPRMRKLSLKLSNLPASDRASLAALMRATGLSTPFVVSVFPNDTDASLERDHMLYGKLSQFSALTYGTVNTTSLPLEIEEM